MLDKLLVRMCIIFYCSFPAIVLANTSFSVKFNDPTASYSTFYNRIESSITAAGLAWTDNFLIEGDTKLIVQVNFEHIATASGASSFSSYVGSSGGINIFEQGAAARIKGSSPHLIGSSDITFNIGIDGYLQNELYFDPDPSSRTGLIPSTQTDAQSVFQHEFGHAFGFNGFRNGVTGQLPGNYESTFDELVTTSLVGGYTTLFFTGSYAEAIYGGPVPLTYGNYGHFGNLYPRSGTDLYGDLMNGIAYYRGVTYGISPLDLAVMQDLGFQLTPAVPEPSTGILSLLTLIFGVAYIRRASSTLVS